MPVGFNVFTGNADFKELPLRIYTTVPKDEEIGEGEIVIYKDGANKYLYWKTQGIVYSAQGTLV